MRFIFSYIWSILWTIIMVYLMFRIPGSNTPSFFPGFDKLAHCGCFFLLSALLLLGRILYSKGRTNKFYSVLIVLLLAGGFALGTEYAQFYFTNYRYGDWWDVFANFTGIGMAIFCFIAFFIPKKRG